jgi:glucokinase
MWPTKLGCAAVGRRCGGLGEAVFGAGKGREIVVYMTISTGVGGARIVGGKIDASAMGFEPGHQIIDACGGK